MFNKIKNTVLFLTTFLLVETGILFSQELEPRSYSVIPKDLNGLVLGYSYSNGAIITEGTSPLNDFNVISHAVVIGGLRSFGLFGKLARVQASIPFVSMSGDVKVNDRDTSGSRTGLADANFRIGINLFGSPAMSPKEFFRFKEEAVLGTSVVVSIPIGQYDKTKLINLGSNRWGFKPEIGFSYGYKNFYFETFTGVWFFTANNEYYKGTTLKRDPIFSLQAHTLYIFPSKLWIGLDLTYFSGGKSQINDVYKNDFMENTRFGGVIGYPINSNHSLKFQVHTGINTAIGTNYTILTLAYQYIWF